MSSGRTTEVLVLTTVTSLPSSPLFYRRSVSVQNLGPNPIYVAMSSEAAVVNKAHKLATNDVFTASGASFSMYAITTVDQVTGAATIVTEMEDV